MDFVLQPPNPVRARHLGKDFGVRSRIFDQPPYHHPITPSPHHPITFPPPIHSLHHLSKMVLQQFVDEAIAPADALEKQAIGGVVEKAAFG
jgi:hypothetical protein